MPRSPSSSSRGVDALHTSAGSRAVAEALEPIKYAGPGGRRPARRRLHGTSRSPGTGQDPVHRWPAVVRGDDETSLSRATLEGCHAPVRRCARGAAVSMPVRSSCTTRRHRLPPDLDSFSGDAINLAARVMGRPRKGRWWPPTASSPGPRLRHRVPPALNVKADRSRCWPRWCSAAGRRPGAPVRVTLSGAPADHRSVGEFEARPTPPPGRRRIGSRIEIVAEPGMGKSGWWTRGALGLRPGTCTARSTARPRPYLPFRHIFHACSGCRGRRQREAARALGSPVTERARGPCRGCRLLATWSADPAFTPRSSRSNRSPPGPRPGRHDGACWTCWPTADGPSSRASTPSTRRGGLLHHLVATGRVRAWLLALTRRPVGTAPLGEEVEPPHRRFELGPLDPAAAAGLLDAGGGDDLGLSEHDRRALLERSGGNPLFLLELTNAVASDQPLDTLPDDLELLLAAQIDRLAPDDRQTLRAAAVLGVWFDLGLLARLLAEHGVPGDIWERLRSLVVPEGPDRDASPTPSSVTPPTRGCRSAAAGSSTTGPRWPSRSAPRTPRPRRRCCPCTTSTPSASPRPGATPARPAPGRRRLRQPRRRHLLPPGPRGLPPPARPGAHGGGRGGRGAWRRRAARRGVRGVGHRLRPGPPADPEGSGRMRLLRKTGVVHDRAGQYPPALRCFSMSRRMTDEADPDAAVEAAEAAVAYGPPGSPRDATGSPCAGPSWPSRRP